MRIIKWIVPPLLFAVCFLGLQRLLMPKYDYNERALVSEYYDEVKDHDVLIVGDCEVYENLSPITLWEDFGVTSFIRGSAQQLIWQSYYLLEEALRYEQPRVVLFNVLAMQYDQPQREEYNRLTLDGMKPSNLKWQAVTASRVEGESALSYAFPLFRYHDRWSLLTMDDLRYYFNRPKVSFNGFMMRCDIRPADMEAIPEGRKRPSYQFGDNSYLYLDKMTALCAENDIPLVLIKAPVFYPYWYPQWDEQMIDYAANNNLLYINCLDYIDEIGLDFDTDTYDAGLHLNLYGAEKLTNWLGCILRDTYDLPDRRGESETAARWALKSEAYARMKTAQESEIQAYGEIRTFLWE